MRTSPVEAGLKRLLDLAGALAGIALLSPLLLAIAAAIRATSPGPVFYRQVRVGRDGRHFRIFKFRSMVVGAEQMGHGLAVAHDDDRTTRVGRVLRRLSLDELPQLFNVVRGEMSLVGPRPTVPSQVEQYTPFERRRLEALPGITGWAAVNGRNLLSWKQRIELDVWYVDHWSLGLDLRILLRTLPALLASSPEQLYGPAGRTQHYRPD